MSSRRRTRGHSGHWGCAAQVQDDGVHITHYRTDRMQLLNVTIHPVQPFDQPGAVAVTSCMCRPSACLPVCLPACLPAVCMLGCAWRCWASRCGVVWCARPLGSVLLCHHLRHAGDELLSAVQKGQEAVSEAVTIVLMNTIAIHTTQVCV